MDPVAARCERMRRGVLNAAREIEDRQDQRQATGWRRWRPVMVTCTYADGVFMEPRHITKLLKNLRDWAGRRGFSLPYVWVLERGSRYGRLHYHVVVWTPPGFMLPKPDKQGWWPFGSTRIERARKPVGYIVGYAKKEKDKAGDPPPKGFRIHGCGGLKWAERLRRAWWSAPRWVRECWPDPFEMPRPCPGGGWVSKVTGEWRDTPYVLCGFHAGCAVVKPRASP